MESFFLLSDNVYLKSKLYDDCDNKRTREFDAHPLWKEREQYSEFHHLCQSLRNYPDKFYEYYKIYFHLNNK